MAETFDSVWDALVDDPAEAAGLRLRSELMIALRAHIETWNVPRAEAARRLGINQARLGDLLRGRVDRFSLDALIDLAARAGLGVRLQIGAAA